jgi:hypothetical protein
MNLSRRVVVAILFAVILLFVGILFWPFILTSIIQPMALVIWLLLRLLVLSIHQKYYWAAIIFAVLVFIFRLLPQNEPRASLEEPGNSNEALNTMGYWRSIFLHTGGNTSDDKNLKRGLAQLLTSIYTSKLRASTNFEIYDALQRGEIPLPEHIHTFLFPEETQVSRNPIKRFLQFTQTVPRQWMRKWTGQDAAERYKMIDEVLCFMETSLEVNNDERESNANKH